MLHYFYGEDTYLAREAVGELLKERGGGIHWLDRQDAEERAAADFFPGGSAGLFGRELFVLRDISSWPKGLQDDLRAVLQRAGESLDCVLWDRAAAPRGAAVYRKLAGDVQSFPRPLPAEVAQWVRGEAHRRGGTLDRAAAGVLVGHAGVDRWRLSAELDKLLLVSPTITAAAVRAAVPAPAAAEIFDILDALSRGRAQRALSGVVTLLESGEGEFYILSMLAYQFRTLYAIRRSIDSGLTPAEIIKTTGIKPYAVTKNYPHAQRFSLSYLREALTRILATDFSIRRGTVDQRTAVLMLVFNLASR
jgi:DNA polymerase III delta subunit